MIVEPIAYTEFNQFTAKRLTDYRSVNLGGSEEDVTDSDDLAEFAGRNCYQAWERKRPSTSTNEGYLKNILNQGHFSVLEHSSVSFYVEGVSRSLLTELERHRFLSFSVVSQRYVRQERDEVVIPPAMKAHGAVPLHPDSGIDWMVADEFDAAMDSAFDAYKWLSEALLDQGLPKKQALEAARSVLPGAAETKFVVTGNLRCWRDVIRKRYHEAADAEIREFSAMVLEHLREFAPNSVQDIPDQPYGGK